MRWLNRQLPPANFDYYPELVVFSESIRVAGTLDLLAVNRHDPSDIALVDWKTNRKIKRTPFKGKRGIRGPGKRLGDCHLVKYGLQLSLYRYLLELDYGVSVRRNLLAHLGPGFVDAIQCNHDGASVQAMLKHDGLL